MDGCREGRRRALPKFLWGGPASISCPAYSIDIFMCTQAHIYTLQNCPRSRIEVRPTALTITITIMLLINASDVR